jgi:hypothetical protein
MIVELYMSWADPRFHHSAYVRLVACCAKKLSFATSLLKPPTFHVASSEPDQGPLIELATEFSAELTWVPHASPTSAARDDPDGIQFGRRRFDLFNTGLFVGGTLSYL